MATAPSPPQIGDKVCVIVYNGVGLAKNYLIVETGNGYAEPDASGKMVELRMTRREMDARLLANGGPGFGQYRDNVLFNNYKRLTANPGITSRINKQEDPPKFGFVKGNVEAKDQTHQDAIIREFEEETQHNLNPALLKPSGSMTSAYRGNLYIFTYEADDVEKGEISRGIDDLKIQKNGEVLNYAWETKQALRANRADINRQEQLRILDIALNPGGESYRGSTQSTLTREQQREASLARLAARGIKKGGKTKRRRLRKKTLKRRLRR
jgi:8-oxo-dGTP pyrophosphatase MutT (NUDIX family)